MLRICELTAALLADKRVRYLAVGGVNFVFGYFFYLALYYSTRSYLHIVVIAVIANIVCITFSFVNYKLFVFRSKGNWLQEYMRCYIVYGGAALLGIAGIWFLVDILNVPFWLAQGCLMVGITAITYFAHSRFSFAERNGN